MFTILSALIITALSISNSKFKLELLLPTRNRNGVPIKRAVFVGRVVSISAPQILENVTAQPR